MSACREAARYYVRNLLGEQGEAARQYLIRRGINASAVKALVWAMLCPAGEPRPIHGAKGRIP